MGRIMIGKSDWDSCCRWQSSSSWISYWSYHNANGVPDWGDGPAINNDTGFPCLDRRYPHILDTESNGKWEVFSLDNIIVFKLAQTHFFYIVIILSISIFPGV